MHIPVHAAHIPELDAMALWDRRLRFDCQNIRYSRKLSVEATIAQHQVLTKSLSFKWATETRRSVDCGGL